MKLCGEAVALGLTPSKAMGFDGFCGFCGFVDFGGGARFRIAFLLNGLYFFGRS